jgi:hypothetical protein
MTDQPTTPAQPGDATVPIVPETGYRQPEVPPLEEPTWPDFTYDNAGGDALFGSSEPTMDFSASAPAVTAPLPSADAVAPVNGGPAPSPLAAPAHTAPLPYVTPQPGLAYQQPTPQPYAQPQPSTYPAQPAHPQQRPYAPAPEPAMYETYQPYTPPAPVVYAYAPTITSAPEHPSAVTSLVLGILGLFVLPILAPIAWVIGGRGRREMRQYPGRWAPSGSLTAGWVMGIIGTLAWGALVAIIMMFMMIAVANFS